MTNIKNRRLVAMIGGTALAGSLAAVVPAVAAWAEPSGCSSSVSGSTSSTGLLRATAKGSCAGYATRTLRVEIKQHLTARPDPLLAAYSDNGYDVSYSRSVSSCDNGRNADYYGRGFFTTNTTYHDTDTTRQTTC